MGFLKPVLHVGKKACHLDFTLESVLTLIADVCLVNPSVVQIINCLCLSTNSFMLHKHCFHHKIVSSLSVVHCNTFAVSSHKLERTLLSPAGSDNLSNLGNLSYH